MSRDDAPGVHPPRSGPGRARLPAPLRAIARPFAAVLRRARAPLEHPSARATASPEVVSAGSTTAPVQEAPHDARVEAPTPAQHPPEVTPRHDDLHPRHPTRAARTDDSPVDPSGGDDSQADPDPGGAAARRSARRRPRTRPASPGRLPTGTASPDEPRLPWWRYRRVDRRPSTATAAIASDASPGGSRPGRPRPAGTAGATGAAGAAGGGGAPGSGPPHGGPPHGADPAADPPGGAPDRPAGLEQAERSGPSGLLWAVLALVLAAVVVVNGQRFELAGVSQVAVPALGLAIAAALAPMLARRHPDEPWLAKMLLLAVGAKILGSLMRYLTLVDAFGNVGDATNYHEWGIRLIEGTHELEDRTGTNFVRWFTSVVYDLVGIDIATGFFVFGLLAFVGAYLWYRATAEAVPFVNKRLYALLVFFAPSIVFWPSSIGKEALMMLGLGIVALGIAHLVRNQFVRGLMIAAPGAWLVWVVRPHLLAMAVLAGGLAYIVGRNVDARGGAAPVSLLRPVGMIALVVVSIFAVNQAADFLGIEELSIEALEEELDEQTGRSAQGGSEIEGGGTSLSPLSLPQGAVTVLLRPFPWEVESAFQILASLEVTALTLFLLYRLSSLTLSLRYFRRTPFLLFCWTFVAMYAMAFASFANFGLLVRQRSLVLPALFVLIAVEPLLARRQEAEEAQEDDTSGHDAGAPRANGDHAGDRGPYSAPSR